VILNEISDVSKEAIVSFSMAEGFIHSLKTKVTVCIKNWKSCSYYKHTDGTNEKEKY
jgi:hypothetical protein